MKFLVLISILLASFAAAAQDLTLYNKAVPSLTISGKRIALGMTHDDFLAHVGFQPIGQVVEPDPANRRSLVIYKRYWEAKQQFLIEWRRSNDPGPYVITRIRVPAPGS